jgi:uncharacterized protein YutE (UPF0331/DUF86 family)
VKVPDETEARILDKTAYIQEAVTVLSRKQSLDERTYRTDREERAIVEREFQTAIEACIDIAGLLIGASDASRPETNKERFEALEELGVLTPETSDQMQEAASFRNVLAHNYGTEIDETEVYQHLQTELEWFVTYLREIKDCLEEANGS